MLRVRLHVDFRCVAISHRRIYWGLGTRGGAAIPPIRAYLPERSDRERQKKGKREGESEKFGQEKSLPPPSVGNIVNTPMYQGTYYVES